jgi:hypothetical protein
MINLSISKFFGMTNKNIFLLISIIATTSCDQPTNDMLSNDDVDQEVEILINENKRKIDEYENE